MAQGSAQLAAVAVDSSSIDPPDLALQGLVLLAQFHGVAADAQQLAHQFARIGEPCDT